jgi:hypothetical protein
MNRYLTIVAVLMMLIPPVLVGAEETVMPPEANWTAYPPARGIINERKLVELLVKKGVITPQQATSLKITPQEAAQLSQASDLVMGSTRGPRPSAGGN